METRARPTILVVGAGFSGSAAAAGLLRAGRPVRVVVVNRFGPIGRGVAYGTRTEAHVLNVPAGNMSALPDDPDHFLRWVREQDPNVQPGTFVSRRQYGEYLEHLLRESEATAVPGATLERVVGEAVSLDLRGGPDPESRGALVRFADGSEILAGHVILALGNYSPAKPAAEDGGVYASDRYVGDPWVRGALDRACGGQPVLLVGTGLTMMDIALDIHARQPRATFHAVSRHGLLPHSHRPIAPAPPPPALALFSPAPSVDHASPTIRGAVRAVRRAVASHEQAGGDWRNVIGSLREGTPAFWRRLSSAERSRFLRHVRPYWEVHRHRAAPATAEAVAELTSRGILSIRRARIVALRLVESGVEATLRPRGTDADEREILRVGAVVNCTGPDADLRRIADPFLEALRRRGLIQSDELGLGALADLDGALIDASGRPSKVLFLVGPLLKARDWEATAVPELRQLAARLAAKLANA